jgi:uncharacterized protein YjbI with pentapeptide repeats
MIGDDELKLLEKELFSNKTETSTTSDLMSDKISLTKNVYINPESKGNCAYLLILKNISLDGSNIESAKLSDITLSNLSLQNAILSNVDFEKSKLTNISFEDSTLAYTNFKNAKLNKVDFTRANLDGANFLNAIIDDNTLKSIALSRYWGNIKIDSAQKQYIQSIYIKSGSILTVSTHEETL